jgi:hypothetical protein
MKRLLLAFLIISVSITACTKKTNEQDTKNISDNKNVEQKKEEDKKEDDKKEEKENSENKDKDTEKKEDKSEKSITAIYDNKDGVVFDKSVDNGKIDEYIKNNNIEIKQNEPITITVKDDKIVDVKKQSNITVSGTYVGLVDSTKAEFSYDGTSFVVSVDENQIAQLENMNRDVLLSLDLSKNNEDGSLVLEKFSKK